MRTLPLQRRVEAALARAVGTGAETGVQVAAYAGEELVVDAVAGLADPVRGRAVDTTTLFHVFSCGKALTATAIHLLVERGLLAYDTPIRAYWPEFGRHGKQDITVRHVLTHTSGVPRLPASTTLGELCDWETMCRLTCELVPRWPAGECVGYHGLTYGWLLGEVARRADGRDFRTLVEQEITGPLGIHDCLAHGVPDRLLPDVAVHLDRGTVPPPAAAGIPADEQVCAAWANDPRYLVSCVPGTATASARGLARLFAALAQGGTFGGHRLLSPGTVAAATAVAVDDRDVLSGAPVRRGLGFLLGRPGHPMSRSTSFGHNGLGGSFAFADARSGLSFALVKNNLTPGDAENDTLARVLRAFDVE